MIGIINGYLNPIIFAGMFKQITTVFLLFAFVAQTFGNGIVLLNYYTNTAAFAKNCINKTRPKMHCNGKCQMMKKMQEEEKKDQQMPERKFEKKMEPISSKSFYCRVTVPVTIPAIAIPYEILSPTRDISFDFFHPPQS